MIAGIIQDQRYYDEAVAPSIDGVRVRYLGAVGPELRPDVLGGATALLHLIGFDEPFGYSVIEAMACGTPVVAYRRGSMPELVEDASPAFWSTTSSRPSRRWPRSEHSTAPRCDSAPSPTSAWIA